MVCCRYDTPRGNPALQPPSVFKRVADAGGDASHVDARDLWFFDTFGYLLLKGVMDTQWLNDANDAMDEFATDPARIRLVPEAVLRANGHEWPEGSSELLKGKPAPGPAQKREMRQRYETTCFVKEGIHVLIYMNE
jgi:hypothetical protein